MLISEKLARSFQKAYERKFGQSISVEDAKQDLSDLAELVKLINEKRAIHYDSKK